MSRAIWFLGEGPEDVGRAPVPRVRIPCELEGDLPRLVRRLVEEAGGASPFGYRAQSIPAIVRAIPRGRAPTRSGGKTKDLRDAMIAVVRSQAPLALIAVIDARMDELEACRADARTILDQCAEERADCPACIGLAVHEVEAWMLADPESRRAAFGQPRDLVAPPEQLSDPKSVWSMLASEASVPAGTDARIAADEQRRAAWTALRSTVVTGACPLGFAPFHQTVVAALRGILL